MEFLTGTFTEGVSGFEGLQEKYIHGSIFLSKKARHNRKHWVHGDAFLFSMVLHMLTKKILNLCLDNSQQICMS
jgi:hypothetical protein